MLWLSCEGQTNVLELFTDSSCVSAVLDRRGLMVADLVNLRTKKAECFSPQALQGFLVKDQIEESQDCRGVSNCLN